jgi:Tetracyclin repressor-like, C-terminal domain
VASSGRAVFAVLVELIRALRTSARKANSAESAQIVWSALHGAVTIEQAGIGQTPNAATTFEHLLDLFTNSLANRH